MDGVTIATIVTLVLTLAGSALGAKYTQAKGKAKKLSKLLDSVIEAAEDDKVTEEEFQKIVGNTKAVLEGDAA